MSYFPNLGVSGVLPSITYGRRRRFNPGGYPGRGRFQRRSGYRVGYRNVGTASAGMFGSVARYDRIPSFRQHPVKGAVAASIMNDHRDVAYHVHQSFRNGLRAARGGGRGFSRFSRFRGNRSRYGRSRYSGGFRRYNRGGY